MFRLVYDKDGLWYGMFSHFTTAGVRHAVSTRLGGVSSPPFSSLNLGLHTGDDAQAVVTNRRRFCEALQLQLESVVTAEQVHGERIAVVDEREKGRGAKAYAQAIKNTDALITNIPGIPLMLFFADCVPVLIVDPKHRAIGISHAGWRGTAARIAPKTILAMQQHYGTDPSQCLIGIGPSIGPCCYEVDGLVVDKLRGQFAGWEQTVTKHETGWQLDLWAANRLQLEEIGVNKRNIVTSAVCTACNHTLFFSYRKEFGNTGRIGAVIEL